MKYKWAIYTKAGVLITRSITRKKAIELAVKWGGTYKQEIFDSPPLSQLKYRD